LYITVVFFLRQKVPADANIGKRVKNQHRQIYNYVCNFKYVAIYANFNLFIYWMCPIDKMDK